MAVVNRVPRGLLGLLDAKTQGQTPNDSAGVLSPTIDLTPNYLADIPFNTAQASAAGNTVGAFTAEVEVPAGELWYAYVCSSEGIALTAAGRYEFVCAVQGPAGTVPVPLTQTDQFPSSIQTALAVGDSIVRSTNWSAPMLFGPGTIIGTRLTAVQATNVNMITSVLYRSVQV